VQGRELNIGSFEIAAFEVPHDSPGGCFGYSIARGAQKVTIATDLGFPTEALASRFADSRAIVIESNHDPDMLENSGRPEWLKRRIREIGHLSNEQCAQFVVTVFASSRLPPDAVVLAHISQVCNTNALAVACTESALARSGRANVHIIETFKRHPSRVLSLD
jgi:phosphoribosyl 1,2-cyclic phosphodiesterase